MYINPQTFRQWWDVFHSNNPVTEIRLLGKDGKFKKTASGYFTDCEAALKAIQEYPLELGIYAPINKIKESCLGRAQNNCFVDSPEATTSDSDIEGRRWILIDFDPKRSSGTNSTEAEKREAKKVMQAVGCYLRDMGFTSPVVADSCNGYHLMYRVNLANTQDNAELIKNFLSALDMFYSNEACEVDTTVFNAARISKVYGSKSVKGSNTASRPQRDSRFLKVPDEIEPTDIAFIKKVVAQIPVKEEPNRFNGYKESFDIEAFIQQHGIEVVRRSRFQSGEKLILKECPFDSNHKAPDSAIFLMDSGAIGFKCLHNSCSSYTWKDVRLHFDPAAYSKRDYQEYEKRRDFYSTAQRPAPIVLEESDTKGHKWLSMQDIVWEDPNSLTYIPTGFKELDKKMGGLALGDVTIISGRAASGKTSILNNILLTAIQHGYKAAIWSGELSPQRFKRWINQAAAGANFVNKSKMGDDSYYCPRDTAEKIDKWTNGKFYLYNNNYGNKSSQILKDVRDCVKEHGTQILVFDNKMAMALDSYDGDKNEKEAGLINELKDFAIQSQLHIILVCHPRKDQMNSLLRMESIAGNSDLYNCASNVFLCHRVGRDFEKRATEFFGADRVKEMMDMNYGEIIEVAKNRSHGLADFILGLYWENKTRRFLNTIDEYVIYGWQESYLPPLAPPIPYEETEQPSSEDWLAYDNSVETFENGI